MEALVAVCLNRILDFSDYLKEHIGCDATPPGMGQSPIVRLLCSHVLDLRCMRCTRQSYSGNPDRSHREHGNLPRGPLWEWEGARELESDWEIEKEREREREREKQKAWPIYIYVQRERERDRERERECWERRLTLRTPHLTAEAQAAPEGGRFRKLPRRCCASSEASAASMCDRNAKHFWQQNTMWGDLPLARILILQEHSLEIILSKSHSWLQGTGALMQWTPTANSNRMRATDQSNTSPFWLKVLECPTLTTTVSAENVTLWIPKASFR